jgi:hypothetical protein
VDQITAQESARPVRRLDQSTSCTHAARYAITQRGTSGFIAGILRTPLVISQKFSTDLAESV